jgi:catechol 2,3-dioxygenase-like lactoylglutathione lyase family enzyme
MILRIHHVQITVPTRSETDARAFYLGVLGLHEIAKPTALKARGGFWCELAGQELHVSLEDGPDRHASKAHLAYQVTDLEHWRQRLHAAGCVLLESIPIPGYARFETRDPFGNRFELIERNASFVDERPQLR